MLLTKRLILSFFILFPLLTNAADDESIHIEADSVEMDEKSGTSAYIGNVKLSQSGLSISADKLVVYTDKVRLTKIVATGAPAKFTQAANEKFQEPITAEANTIEYDAQQQSLTLTRDVLLTQGENRFSGEIVEYDIRNNVMKASGASSKKRVQAIIQLDKLN